LTKALKFSQLETLGIGWYDDGALSLALVISEDPDVPTSVIHSTLRVSSVVSIETSALLGNLIPGGYLMAIEFQSVG
jgi:hypothetical protein